MPKHSLILPPDLQLLQRLGLDPASTLLDLGAGTGEFALAAAAPLSEGRRGRYLAGHALDAPGKSRHPAEDEPPSCPGRIPLNEHPGDPVDFVYSRNVLHHLPDFWKVQALPPRSYAAEKPVGCSRLCDLVYSFPLEETEDRIGGWLNRAPTDVRDGFPRSELEVHVREEYSTFNWLLEPMLQRTGFDVEDVHYSSSGNLCRIRLSPQRLT